MTALWQVCSVVCAWHAAYVGELQRHGAPADRAARTASAVLAFAPQAGVDPHLVLALITVENPTLAVRARSHRGATGPLQVMPGWLKQRPDWAKACGDVLTNIRTNVCWGTRILALHLAETKTLRAGLLAFNGCRRRGTSCTHYPDIVLRRRAQLVQSMVQPPTS
jgi:soluble lytic murein transglycosylase-like protein